MTKSEGRATKPEFVPNARDAEELERFRRLTGPKRRVGPPLGNQNTRKHGVYVSNFLSDDEREFFEQILERLHGDFIFNNSSDLIQVELVAVYFLRLARAQAIGDADSAERFDRMIRGHLKDLKTTKLAREGDQPKGPETSPAEWATRLLENARQRRKVSKRKTEEAATSGGTPVPLKKRGPKTRK